MRSHRHVIEDGVLGNRRHQDVFGAANMTIQSNPDVRQTLSHNSQCLSENHSSRRHKHRSFEIPFLLILCVCVCVCVRVRVSLCFHRQRFWHGSVHMVRMFLLILQLRAKKRRPLVMLVIAQNGESIEQSLYMTVI